MKVTTVIYLVLAVLGAAAAVLLPLQMYRSGSTALPGWRAAVVPGPLSAAHAFLDAQCESCHTPDRGVEAASCVTCHATAAPELLTKPSTAFHANIGECAGCHVEHQGRDRRPINMDHSVLATVGHARAAETEARASASGEASFRHAVAKLQALLSGSGADLVGGLWTDDPFPAVPRRPSTARVATPTAIHIGRSSAKTARVVTTQQPGRSPPSGTRRLAPRIVCSATKPRPAIT